MATFSFGDQTILVTAASGGIGTAVCERLARQGAALVLTARDLARLEALAKRLLSLGARSVHCIPADMGDLNSTSAFAAELADKNIYCDGMVFMIPQPHRSSDPMPANDVWETLFRTSFIGPLAMLNAVVNRMSPDPAKGKRCKIAVVSGISSAQVLSHYATANVIRCAWVGEIKTLAFALGARGIHLNTLSLGGTLSPWYVDSIKERAARASMTYEDFMVKDTDNVPLRKYGMPEEVAGAIEGLLSPFSDHMTGTNIMHDGGFTRAY